MIKKDDYACLDIVNTFKPLYLNELDKVKLLDRKDTKYVFNQFQLPSILEQLIPFYKILEIDNERVFIYDTIYFDTHDFQFYKQHHNGNKKRYKIRSRTYQNTGQSFFEIKVKNNKNRTIKKRQLLDEAIIDIGEKEQKFISDIIGTKDDKYIQKLKLKFFRITLVDNDSKERLTIDTNLIIKNSQNNTKFSKLVIAEIKQNKFNPKSNFIRILQNHKIQDMRFSKYCMGILHINEHLKYNRFKPRIFQINKILSKK